MARVHERFRHRRSRSSLLVNYNWHLVLLLLFAQFSISLAHRWTNSPPHTVHTRNAVIKIGCAAEQEQKCECSKWIWHKLKLLFIRLRLRGMGLRMAFMYEYDVPTKPIKSNNNNNRMRVCVCIESINLKLMRFERTAEHTRAHVTLGRDAVTFEACKRQI